MPDPQSPWIVMKFGGTSVSSRERWGTIADVIRQRRSDRLRPFVVCSAISRISRMLNALLDEALHGTIEPLLDDIKHRHAELASDLGVDVQEVLGEDLETLERLALGATLTRDVSPPLRARVLAMGELMLTKLGGAFLEQQGLRTRWHDARHMLTAVEQARMLPHRRYLAATCDFTPDPDLQSRLAGEDAAVDVDLTQGFIAGNPAGETVLVGWGGSDTSASYFASKLQAQRLEIWTDVPGMFTANPRLIPSARLLRSLGYDEAQELASTGAEVLHPRSIDPVRRQSIPLHVLCTQAPDLEHTVIGDDVASYGAQVKAISARPGIMLVTMETPGMWHEVGFLARAFNLFERHDLSIDLIATSETSVTVSLDAIEGTTLPEIDSLLGDLNAFCNARQIGPCAAVSLVGRNLRSILHELGPALEVLDEQHVHLVSQASSDLNFTFVVDEEHADRLVRKMHAQFFDRQITDGLFGPSWRELFGDEPGVTAGTPAWWRARRDDLLALADERAPCYVYDEATLHEAVDHLEQIDAVDRRFYAMKANPHPDVLRLFHAAGLGFECVSPGEIDRVRSLFPDLDPDRLLFTPNFAPRDEYATALEAGAHVTLDNLHPLEFWPELFAGRDVIVRVDPGQGHGHHRHVRTAGAQSKFGVVPDELERLRTLADENGTRIVGLHAHVGSGVTTSELWAETALFLASLADQFPDVCFLNLGGGLGVPERPGDPPLDVSDVAASLEPVKKAHPRFELWMEPGRYLVAQAGVLLARVTQVKRKGSKHYVGLETGMNSLIRPALYGAYHEIVNLSRLGEPMAVTADVVGPICETGDVLGYSRRLPETHEGDVLLIATTGAYGRAMSSSYNLRPPAGEAMLQAANVQEANAETPASGTR